MIYIRRDIGEELKKMAKTYPVITLTGPRQSGKTTLVKHIFPKKTYLSLEDPDIRELAQNDAKGFLQAIPEGAILDEIQLAPDLISYIQTIVDKEDKSGMFILTGSNQFSLLNSVNQSLAGRTAILKLLPLSIDEISTLDYKLEINDYLYKGFYPAIYSKNRDVTKIYSNYYQTYLERDIRRLINIKNLTQFRIFIQLCAGRVGQILNVTKLANETGISVPTVKSWISILEASYILYTLPPWFDNISKRLIKSPKIYFYDVGLASYLLGIRKKEHLIGHPLRGNLFENLVVSELFKKSYNSGIETDFYFLRDNHGVEIDVIIPDGQHIIPIEIKSSQTFHSSFLKNLHSLKKIYNERIQKSYLIYSGDTEQTILNTSLLNYKNATDQILK